MLWISVVALALIGLYELVVLVRVNHLADRNPETTALMEARLAHDRERGKAHVPAWHWVPLDRISPHLQRAVITAEDASFYQHNGFDWDGIVTAFSRNVRSGRLRRGGSTITQQLAKNLYLSPEKTLLRKSKEALITVALEWRLSKPRIFELYLNVVEWGRGVYGAEAAARHHFNKSARDLTPDEAALLAAILPSPRAHDPLKLTPFLAKRREQIRKDLRAVP
jgi:monofunctional biosynthetic peptidoglycan transglycosylase